MSSSAVLRLVVVGVVAQTSEAFAAELYTQNPLCRQNACTNPIFPGLNDMPRLEKLTWQCTSDSLAKSASSYMTFCKDAVRYNPALPSPNVSATPVDRLIKAQDDAAATMFFYHLSGLGYEAWDHQEPAKSADSCVRATWRMVCYTYFPKAEAGCQHGEPSLYRRPCMNSCSDYMKSCQVECCDESPKCVFEHSVDLSGGTGNGSSALQTGYVQAEGPSSLCTGGFLEHSGGRSISASFALIFGLLGLHAFAGIGPGRGRRQAARGVSAAKPTDIEARKGATVSFSVLRLGRWLVACVLVAVSMLLQGCGPDDMQVPKHSLGNWRGKADYLVSYEYVPIGAGVEQASLNSCSGDTDLSATLQCSGRGYCKAWNVYKGDSISFCSCDPGFADPECRTERKSQTKTFLWALFGGIFGADYFYLGFPLWGLAKLFSLGGFGFWWLIDIIRTGSGAVYAHNYRVSQDLPHWAYVISVVGIFMVAGFAISMESYFRFRNSRRKELLMMQQSAENRDFDQGSADDNGNFLGPQYSHASRGESFSQPREFVGYGATMPGPLPNAGAPVIPSVQMAPHVHHGLIVA